MFFTLFGYRVQEGRGGSQGIGTQPAYAVTLGSSKIEVCEPFFFFDTVTTQNYHPRYEMHVLARIYVVFPLFWVCVAQGRFPARWTCQRQ